MVVGHQNDTEMFKVVWIPELKNNSSTREGVHTSRAPKTFP